MKMTLNELRAKYGDAIIQFHKMGYVTRYYECRDMDAHTVNEICGLGIESEYGTDYCMIGSGSLENVIEALNRKGHKVAVLDNNVAIAVH